jgi:hypothetical protein
MWQLLAASAAGLNAGASLHSALTTEPPSPTNHSRTRLLSLALASTTSACCVQSYTNEDKGNLWIAAAVVSSLIVPYQLLIMSPPTTYNNGGGGNSGSAMSTVPNASNKTQSSIVSLMYHTRSGLLVTSEELASSMSRKYWFAAALGCAVFGGIMAMVGSSRDAATYTDTPF